jgi:uncharacterized protein YecT (DUF1311 family)
VKRSLLVAALLLLVVPTAASAATMPPPPISESFTLLPCPAKPQTTLDLEGCAEHKIVKLDKQIDALVKTIFKALPDDPARQRFVLAQRSWLAYRQADCASRSDVNEGGSLAGVAFAVCAVARNTQRLKDLRTFANALRPH